MTELTGQVRAMPTRVLAGLDTRQWIKLVVYSLLTVNFFIYLSNDVIRTSHTFQPEWGLFDWTSAFAASLDILAWLTLLFLLELETYLLSDEAFTRRRVRIMQGIRLLCIVAIGHTVIAYGDYLIKLEDRIEHANVELCSFADTGISFTRNLDYWELDADNCRTLATGSTYYTFDKNQLISDRAGLVDEWGLALADFVEILVWLLILALIELIVRLQERGITRGRALEVAKTLNGVLYGVLWVIAGYWAWLGQWVFAWDESLWILGFMAIGMNLSEWREDIEAGGLATPVPDQPEASA